ncbi:MAG: hypothetical protein METHP_02072 [Methanoregula sp. SKADARSKE-2]|nr:MAG: hypothetical protein METHP_02072 [Methanoregula sp. SKADARSKE-2]
METDDGAQKIFAAPESSGQWFVRIALPVLCGKKMDPDACSRAGGADVFVYSFRVIGRDILPRMGDDPRLENEQNS